MEPRLRSVGVSRSAHQAKDNHPGATPPAEILDEGLEPRGLKIRETLDVKRLGYDYAGSAATVPGTNPGGG